MRKIPASDKFSIYFGTAPMLLGEVFIIVGIVGLFDSGLNIERFAGASIFFLIGGFFVFRKMRVLLKGISVLENGKRTEAVLSWIIDTNTQHNKRIVKEYLFEYHVDGTKYSYEYRSAYKRHLRIGDRMPLFYLPDNPSNSFIPKLYNVYIQINHKC